MTRIASLFLLMLAFASHALAADESPSLSIREALSGLNSQDAKVRESARGALQFDVWPYDPSYLLDSKATDKEQSIRRQLKAGLQNLLIALESVDEEVVLTAAGVLSMLGREASAALPRIEQIINDPERPIEMKLMLAVCSVPLAAEQRPALSVYFRVHNEMLQEILQQLPDEESVDLLAPRKEAKDQPDFARIELSGAEMEAEWLWMVLSQAGRGKTEVPALLEAASPGNPRYTRVTAIRILSRLRDEAHSAAPGLRRLLNDRDHVMRVLSAFALLSVDRKRTSADDLVQVLELTREQEREFRRYVAEGLHREACDLQTKLETAQRTVTDEVQMLRKTSNPLWERNLIRSLGVLGPVARPAIPTIEAFLIDRDEATRDAADEAIRRIEGRSEAKAGWSLPLAF